MKYKLIFPKINLNQRLGMNVRKWSNLVSNKSILLQFRLIINMDVTMYLCAHEINESMTAFGADDEI